MLHHLRHWNRSCLSHRLHRPDDDAALRIHSTTVPCLKATITEQVAALQHFDSLHVRLFIAKPIHPKASRSPIRLHEGSYSTSLVQLQYRAGHCSDAASHPYLSSMRRSFLSSARAMLVSFLSTPICLDPECPVLLKTVSFLH